MRDLSRLTALAAALLVMAAMLLPPFSTLAAQLFSAHMARHLLVVAVAAPLLVLSGIELPLKPVLAWVLFVGIFLFWHWPAAFQFTAAHDLTIVELGSLLVAATAFWSVALGGSALNDGARALYVMTAAVVTDLPGVVMLFAPRAFCTLPHGDAAAFGFTPLQDQQIAGLLMWVPANLAFFGIATFLFARWMREPNAPVTS
jgi:cytochrome c oxidase assembly factor CtaG